jgi:hypothetical protein
LEDSFEATENIKAKAEIENTDTNCYDKWVVEDWINFS